MINQFCKYILAINNIDNNCIYNNVQLYLYSSQDLIMRGDSTFNIRANTVYWLNLAQDQIIYIYSTSCCGCIILNKEIIDNQLHSQIIFHRINDNTLLCEIKPFVDYEPTIEYAICNRVVKLCSNTNTTNIYVDGKHFATLDCESGNTKIKKIEKENEEVGILEIGGHHKHIILFSNKGIEYCGHCYDYEILNDRIQIYRHNSNIFNLGQLIIYNFKTKELEYKQVADRGDEQILINKDFCLIYFVDAIKCGRYKYAYNLLSYELKSIINIATIKKYFPQFDNCIYLQNQDVFIMINNKKIVGIYNIKIKNNLINNIY